jgi:hypothetical protein
LIRESGDLLSLEGSNLGENRSQFLLRHLKAAMVKGQPTSDLVGKLYASEMDRIGDQIDDGLGEGFKLGDLGAGTKVKRDQDRKVSAVEAKPYIRKVNGSDFSWVETFTKKSFDNCKKFFHELVQAENVIGHDVQVKLVIHKTGSLYEVYLDVSFLKYSDEDITKRPPGFVAVEKQWRTEFDAIRKQKVLHKEANQGHGLETFDFENWESSIRRWVR